jgi:hypothetical protein
MPGYVQVIERIPKPGKNEIVLQRSVGILKSLNRRGVVMESVSDATDRRVVGLLPFESIADLEAFHDGYRTNSDAIKSFEENSVDCDRVRMDILQALESPVRPDGGPKYWARNLLVAKRGELPNLVAVMREMREMAESVTFGLTRTVGGNSDSLRVGIQLSSLDQLEDWNNELVSDKFQSYREKINTLTVQRTTELHRVEYSTQG